MDCVALRKLKLAPQPSPLGGEGVPRSGTGEGVAAPFSNLRVTGEKSPFRGAAENGRKGRRKLPLEGIYDP